MISPEVDRLPATDFAPARIEVERLANEDLILRSPQPLQHYPSSLGEMLRRYAVSQPNRAFLAERDGNCWRRLTYADALTKAEAIGESLLERGLGPDRPLMILSPNSINHASLILGGYLAGVPVAPVSPAYALTSHDFGKLRHVISVLRPGLLYVDSTEKYTSALGVIDIESIELVTNTTAVHAEATAFNALCTGEPSELFHRATAAVSSDTVAKYLFTSGSTGLPKGVINTHGMLCANQQMILQCWPFLDRSPPVFVDWLPWNHTFGGNKVFHMVLSNGGTLYIDAGRPVTGLIETTIENLRDVSPSVYFNVPAGFAQLLPYLEQDDRLCETFFRDLNVILFAAAAMPQHTRDRLDAFAMKIRRKRVPIMAGWGATETAPVATLVHFLVEDTRVIGLPTPGVEIKLTKTGDKTEILVRGPNITPGYLSEPELTRAAFDADGFYRTGDATAFLDPQHPEKGLIFDGRVAEDFKLTTGTWVNVGMLRVKVLDAASPLLQDAVIAGENRDFVGVLAWLNISECRNALPHDDRNLTMEELVSHLKLRGLIRDAMIKHNNANHASSTRIDRVILLAAPPDIDANEITDKGYINQRAVVNNRSELVRQLYSSTPDEAVTVVPPRNKRRVS